MGRLPFFKKTCLVCTMGIASKAKLCESCQQKVKPIPQEVCYRCCCRVPLADTVCGACLKKPPAYDHVAAMWVYDDLSAHLIQRLKFKEDFSTLPYLLEQMSAFLCDHYQNQEWPEVVLPVPLHFSRLWQRGFNQAVVLGRALAKKHQLAFYDNVLIKTKKTQAQVGLHFSERASNLRAAFKVKRVPACQHVVLVDDVMTTGSTVHEAAKTLKLQGVRKVSVWVLARAFR